MVGARVHIGGNALSTLSGDISRDQRYRGIALIERIIGHRHVCRPEKYAFVNLRRLRAALDAVTLDDAERVNVPVHTDDCSNLYLYIDADQGRKLTIVRSETQGDRVYIIAPCGQRFAYKVRTLDRALTRLGA